MKTNLATFYCQKSFRLCSQYIFHVTIRCLKFGSQDVHQTQIWVMLRKVWEPLG